MTANTATGFPFRVMKAPKLDGGSDCKTLNEYSKKKKKKKGGCTVETVVFEYVNYISVKLLKNKYNLCPQKKKCKAGRLMKNFKNS